MKMQFFSFICVVFMCNNAECSNILAIFNMPSKSHTILGVKLTEGLIKRGHQVTLVTPYDIEPMENCTHIHLKTIQKYKDKVQHTMVVPQTNPILGFFNILKFLKEINTLFWEEPGIQKIISEKPKYDAVISFSFFNDALLGIPHHLGVPIIFFSPIGANSMGNSYMANPNMVYVPNTFIGMPANTFLERLISVTAGIMMNLFSSFIVDPSQEETLKKYLPNAPPLQDLKKNVSLMLLNSHYSIESPRPYVPNMIQIGGFHLQDEKELPKDIKNYLDNAKHGAILFSMGSNVLISSIDDNKQKAIFKVLGEMAPLKVLFKSELEHKDLPKNIMVTSWLPQAEILGHPNTKVFISHGGLGGNTEAVYHGVPILGIPFFGDQRMNLEEAQTAGYAEIVQIQDLNEDIFRTKLKEVRDNPKYRENVKKRSALMKEQPVKPMDNAAFWIGHIIRFRGGSHLRNAGMDFTWYQFYMVDIYIFYTILACLVLTINYYVLKLSLRLGKRLIFGKSAKVKTQ